MNQPVNLLSIFLAASGLLVADLQAAVSFTVSPVAVSNTYNGPISFQIGGLTNGETVRIEKFLDANADGIVGAKDGLMQSFLLIDGQASVIGGITNRNVPGDSTAANGAITAQVAFAGDIAQQIVGQYIFKLSSPTGRFSPLTSLFNVTNFAYGQSLSGAVRCSGTNVPNVIVMVAAANSQKGSPIAGVVANNSGNYSIKLPAGAYSFFLFKSNFVADLTLAPAVNLGAGAAISTNLTFLFPATRTLSGRVVDASNPSLGLPGIFVFCQSANNQIANGLTDAAGNFSVPVTASQWEVGLDDDGLGVYGYLRLQNNNTVVDTSTGSVAGVTVALPKGTALLYGSVKDGQNRPIAGLHLYAEDDTHQYEGLGVSDQNGNYCAAVLAGNWYINPDSSSLPNYIFAQGNNIALTAGQAVQQNFTGTLATNHISGFVRNAGNNPVAGVGVYGYATINGVTFNQYQQTDGSGYYSISVVNGNWNVGINCSGASDSLQNQGYECVSEQPAMVANNNPVVNFTVQPCGPLQITTSSPLLGGQAGNFYGMQFQASGCNQPFSWALAPGSASLPAGIILFSDGNFTGIPGSSGTFNFTVRVTSNMGEWADRSFSVTIDPSLPPLQITTTILPNGVQNSFYSQQFTASGGQQPYSWWLPGGTVSLPPGSMSLSSSGVLSGTPTGAGPYQFWVGVYDNAAPQNSVTQLVSLTINSSSPLQVMTTSLPSGTSGLSYSQACSASGGLPPYTWSLSPGSGNPPPGLSLASNGQLSGTPTNGGTYYFYVRVTDAVAATADQFLSLTINNPPLQVTNTTLPVATLSGVYSAQLGAIGGQPPYSWSLALGSASLPPGLSLNPSGLISGTPTNSGLFSFIVKVTDASLASVTRILAIQANPRPTLGLASRPSATEFQFQVNGTAGQNYTIQNSSDLVTWTWVAATNPPGDSFTVLLNQATNNRSYYRVLVGP